MPATRVRYVINERPLTLQRLLVTALAALLQLGALRAGPQSVHDIANQISAQEGE